MRHTAQCLLCSLLLVGCAVEGAENAGGVTIVEARIMGFAEQAKESGYNDQAIVLQDGVVTEAEYRRAYVNATECMERAGMEVEYLQLVPSEYGGSFDGMFAPGALSPEQASEVSNTCEIEHDSFVGQGWNTQQGDLFTAEATTLMVDCLQDRDVIATGSKTIEDFIAAGGSEAALECLARTRLSLRAAAGVPETPIMKP